MELTKEEQELYKDILKKTFVQFDKLCKQYNITYLAAGGTMLGAVRHNDIIPWDDDIDVYMFRNDYERFLSLKESLNETGYGIIDSTDNTYYLPFAKFYDAKSSIWEIENIPCIYGVYIDVFVLDVVQGTFDEVAEFKRKYDSLSNKYLISSIERPWKTIFKQLYTCRIDKFVWYIWQKHLHSQKAKIVYSMEQTRKKTGNGSKKWVVPFGGTSGKRDIYPLEWFETFQLCRFGDMEIHILEKYDAYLSNLYGDYMTPPPIEKQVTHHLHYYFNPKRLVSVENALLDINGK